MKSVLLIFYSFFPIKSLKACPQCTEPMHPSDIQALLKPHPNVISKYEGKIINK